MPLGEFTAEIPALEMKNLLNYLTETRKRKLHDEFNCDFSTGGFVVVVARMLP